MTTTKRHVSRLQLVSLVKKFLQHIKKQTEERKSDTRIQGTNITRVTCGWQEDSSGNVRNADNKQWIIGKTTVQ